ncbi:MAG: hypothetical protein ABR987_15560, partial [Terracidiphilus sp.]
MKGGMAAVPRGLLLVAVFSAAALAQTSNSSAGSGSTLQVGLWTLWHDRAVTVSPATEAAVMLRRCESCAAFRLIHPISVRAADDSDLLAGEVAGGRQTDRIYLTGAFSVGAHGESLTL